MSRRNIEVGCEGEAAAASFLKKNGYKIICMDYRTSLGQVDIIAKEKNTICFIEVKTRVSQRSGPGSEAVQAGKQKKIAESAIIYLKNNNLLDSPARFDVVAVSLSGNRPEFELIKDAFPVVEGYTY